VKRTILAPSEGFDEVQRTVQDHLSSRIPDAIVAATDSMAGAVLKACETQGLQVPKDIRITGFNGFDVACYIQLTLTTVVSPAYEMGRCAGQVLMGRLQGKRFSKRSTVFAVPLQEGEST
jgi:DNA-binding LacI/PurR family transcriptional regulator